MRLCTVLIVASLASPALAQNDCDNRLLGQPGCGVGMRPYVESMGNTLGSRGTGWATSDPVEDDGVLGARGYNSTLGRSDNDDSFGSSISKCGTILSGPCDN